MTLTRPIAEKTEARLADAKAFEFGYSPALDGIRGLAILAVLAFNGHLPFARGGFIGVDIFFVLSGFLITTLLVQEHRRTSSISLKNFYYRRALRLLPALFGLMLFCATYAVLFQSGEKAALTWKGILYTLFYVANWAQIGSLSATIGALSHAWSLSVEEQFYIIWPLSLILLLKLRNRRWIVGVLFILIASSIASSAWLWHHQPNYLRMYFGSDTRAHELLIGCVAALLVNWGVVPQTRSGRLAFQFISVISTAAILFSIFEVRHYSGFVYNGGFTLISLGVATIIIDLVIFRSPLLRIFAVRPLAWIGKISYGLYLWHFPIFYASKQMLAGRVSPIVYSALGFILAFVIATFSYYVVEKPFLKLRRRYDPATVDQVKSSALLPRGDSRTTEELERGLAAANLS